MSRFRVLRKDGTEVHSGDKIASFRGERWTFGGCNHSRKIWVYQDLDSNLPKHWPNRTTMEYYANVFDLGIWDNDHNEWSFGPSWGNQVETVE